MLALWILVVPMALVGGFQPSPATSVHPPALWMRPSLPVMSTPELKLMNTSSSRHRHSSSLGASTTPTAISTSSKENTSKPSFPVVLWRFTRPHTIIGSALAIPALHMLAAPTYAAAFTTRSLCSMLYAMVPALLMNLYITGLNQVTDVEIDKINKPDLPIAAGDLSMKNGIITILVAVILSLSMGFAHPVFGTQGLNVALWVSGILGTLYSLEPFRLKRFPFLAAFCIVSVRGAVINAGFFAHARAAAFGASGSVMECLTSDPRCILSSLYFAVFGIVIALMKDVPDVKGDAISNVRTFSVRLGQKRVFGGMHRLLTALFVGVGASFLRSAFLTSSSLVIQVGRGVVGLSAVLAGLSVQKEAKPVDPDDSKQVYNFYMHLWKLFYLSYLVLPLAR
mmetsp:Transcript_5114/g.14594  ORF Transcript_5114/g.14594 Transcript_5114/m.14594 type:complete len:396 (-) Transcript_5114:255-1442(-)